MKKIIWIIVVAIIVWRLPSLVTRSLVMNYEAMRMPGKSLLDLEPGDYHIFFEERNQRNNEGNSIQTPAGLECKMAGENQAISLSPPPYRTTYSVLDKQGIVFYEFTVAQAGSYTLSCDYPAGIPEKQVTLIVEQQSLWLIRLTAIGLSIFLLAMIILFLTPGKKKVTNNERDLGN